MNHQKFYGLYCGYSQQDIEEMIEDIHKRGGTSLMDNYSIIKKNKFYIMEDKWETESPKTLYGSIEKIVLDSISIECIGEKSRFTTYKELVNYMIQEEEQDMKSYLQHENEWEF